MRLFRDGGDCERDYEGWMVNNHKKHGRRLRRGRRRGRYRQTQTRTRQLRGRTPDATVGHWQVLHTARRLEKRIIGIGRLDDERALEGGSPERRHGRGNDQESPEKRRTRRRGRAGMQGMQAGVRVWKEPRRKDGGGAKALEVCKCIVEAWTVRSLSLARPPTPSRDPSTQKATDCRPGQLPPSVDARRTNGNAPRRLRPKRSPNGPDSRSDGGAVRAFPATWASPRLLPVP